MKSALFHMEDGLKPSETNRLESTSYHGLVGVNKTLPASRIKNLVSMLIDMTGEFLDELRTMDIH